MMQLDIRRESVPASDIEAHLRECDAAFVPTLSTRVDIGEYAGRLAGQARLVSAHVNDKLIGLVAYYVSPDQAEAFISSVSVDAGMRGTGVARQLLDAALVDAMAAGVARVRLQVGRENGTARRFYVRAGFGESGCKDDQIEMTFHPNHQADQR